MKRKERVKTHSTKLEIHLKAIMEKGEALDITGDNLEDLLAYDDLFLDYFNAFLGSHVFPLSLFYNRLTGAFDETDQTEGCTSSQGTPNQQLSYGPTDDERDKLLSWARAERLPLFLRTQLFREFKLCKLLLRPLDDRYSAGRNSTHLRGYSRQSESYVSSFSNSADNSGNDEIDDDDVIFVEGGALHHSELYRYQRPGSKAYSVPTRLCLESEITYGGGSTMTRTQESWRPNSQSAKNIKRSKREMSHVQVEPVPPDSQRNTRQSEKKSSVVKFDTQMETFSKKSGRSPEKNMAPFSDVEEAFRRHARALSAPVNYEEYMRHPVFQDMYDALFGEDEPDPRAQAYVTFDEEKVSEEQTETDVKNLEGRLKMSLQQLKEQTLGTFEGMQGFHDFLKGTAGEQLLEFWMDCEYFKDSMESFDDKKQLDIRNRLFRSIQDKYRMTLTDEARKQIATAASNSSLSHTIFIRTQYDVLRRLRAYWVPRFLIHRERLKELREIGSAMGIAIVNPKPRVSSLPFFPSISLVNSMPVNPDNALTYTRTKTWDLVCRGGRSLDARVTSANQRAVPPSRQLLQSRSKRIAKSRFLMALSGDKEAGGPFQRFLQRQNNGRLESMLQFWQEVTEYGQSEDRSADRLLRLCHAWTIFNKYVEPSSSHTIGLLEIERISLYNILHKAQDFIEASVFNPAKNYAMGQLEQAWMRYLKEDLKTFLDAHVKNGAETPPSTADVIDIQVTNTDLIITRPDPWVKSKGKRFPIVPRLATSESQRARNRYAAGLDEIDAEKKREQRARAREKRKEMEKERKKAIRAAYRRQKEAKQKKEDEGEEEIEYDENGEKKLTRPPPTFSELAHNKQIITNFKKHLNELDAKDKVHMISLYMELHTYLNLGNSKADVKKKETAAGYIQKTFLDNGAKKHVTLPDKFSSKAGDRPKTAAMKEIFSIISPKIDESFQAYLMDKAAENGMEPREFAGLSQAELALRLGNDAALLGGGWRKGRKGKPDEDGEAALRQDNKLLRELEYPALTVNLYEHEEIVRNPRHVRFASDLDEEQRSYESTESNHVTSLSHPKIRVQKCRQELSKSRSNLETSAIKPHSVVDESGMGRGTSSRLDSMQGPGGRRRGRKNFKTGRAQATREDRDEFYKALKESAAGHLTILMLYFYKYLQKHGEEENNPLLDKDLFFYIEVQKFKDCSHAYADEESLRRKVQSIVDCFLETSNTPPLQVDIPQAIQDKVLRAAQRYLAGKEVVASVFDDAQLMVFKELLQYWAGFKRSFQPPDDPSKRPITKHQKMLRKRLEAIENYEIPPNVFMLPSIPEGAIAAYSFSLSDGVKWRELSSEEAHSILGSNSPIERSETATTLRGGKTFDQLRKRRKSISQGQMSIHGMSSREASTLAVKD